MQTDVFKRLRHGALICVFLGLTLIISQFCFPFFATSTLWILPILASVFFLSSSKEFLAVFICSAILLVVDSYLKQSGEFKFEFLSEYGVSLAVVLTAGVFCYFLMIAKGISKANRMQFEIVFESAPNGILMANEAGEIVLVNREIEEQFGYTRAELIGKKVETLVPEEYKQQHPHERKKFMKNPMPRSMGSGRELFGLRKDGSRVPIEIGLNPVNMGKETFVLATVIDISHRKQAENKFHLVVESAPNAMVMINKERIITLVNRKTESLFGYPRNKLVGEKVEILIPDKFRANHPELVDNFFSQPSAREMGKGRDLFGVTAEGKEVPIEIGLNPIISESGAYVLASIVDITDRKKSEEQLRAHQKRLTETNRQLDEFAYIISHDLKAPLRGIGQIADWLYEDYFDQLDDEAKENLTDLKNRVTRMKAMIDGVLSYSRLDRSEILMEPVDLNECVNDVIDILDPQDDMEINITNNLPSLLCERTQITQVFQNLISNAIRYIDKEEGKITINCDQEDGFWKFSVADNGPGIEQEQFDRIFKIFQTLSPRDKSESTGIGLTISKKIVELHGGKIWLDSEMNKGTTFFFSLPSSSAKKGQHA